MILTAIWRFNVDNIDYNKLRGGYYTPEKICDWIVSNCIGEKDKEILEPSCGDGNFLQSLCKYGYSNVTAVELDAEEAKKASKYGFSVINNDFFSYYKDNIDGIRKYDMIVGNPPFIRYQNFIEEYRTIAFSLMNKYGFHPNRMTNIWLPFLVLSCMALKEDGKLCMVIPAELFQVDYAAETRLFLSDYFEKLTLITFKELIFEDIQQEVIILYGERKSQEKGIKVLELDNLASFDCLEHEQSNEIKKINHTKDKWVKYYLSNSELELLDALNNDDRISSASDLFEINVGLVSGENKFFVLNKEQVSEKGLIGCVEPIVSRSDQLQGAIFSNTDLHNLQRDGKRVYLFSPAKESSMQGYDESEYIHYGEEIGISKNYKCRIRKPWYHIKKTWLPEGFFIRQANKYPKMILNNTKANVTDTVHKIRFIDSNNKDAIVSAFYNTYTFALAETLGRSYGGGVLTFEPNEVRSFRIPMLNSQKLDIQLVNEHIRNGKIEEMLFYTDKILLMEGLGLSNNDIQKLHSIWDKLSNRRLTRKRSAAK